ncbi:hypothetical protein ALC53_04058 [Atta colombica]|uniref:Uncharacterized protein n=1 Tax=Atta colombica TaxID=520822 RepID=A0A195BN58_9HYME|nr:hypothetical protein ALC53_04058 [Atta colombica]
MEYVYTTCNAESEEIANRSKIGNFSRVKLRCHCEHSLEGEGEGDSVSAPVPPLTHAGNGFVAPYDLDYRGLMTWLGKKYPNFCTLQSFRGENSFDQFYTSSPSDSLGFDLAIIAYLTRLQRARTFLHRSSWNRGLLVLTGDYSNYFKAITRARSHQLLHCDSVDNYTSRLCDMNSEGRPHDTLAWHNRHGRLKVVDFNERKVN